MCGCRGSKDEGKNFPVLNAHARRGVSACQWQKRSICTFTETNWQPGELEWTSKKMAFDWHP
jgi:hypothetical protein